MSEDKQINMNGIGSQIYDFAGKLFPICRSITGAGVRKTFELINEELCASGAPRIKHL